MSKTNLLKTLFFLGFLLSQLTICLTLSAIAGLIQMQIYLWPNRVNEFAGMYIVVAVYLTPIIFAITLPFHIYFYYFKITKLWWNSILCNLTVVVLANLLLLLISR